MAATAGRLAYCYRAGWQRYGGDRLSLVERGSLPAPAGNVLVHSEPVRTAFELPGSWLPHRKIAFPNCASLNPGVIRPWRRTESRASGAFRGRGNSGTRCHIERTIETHRRDGGIERTVLCGRIP